MLQAPTMPRKVKSKCQESSHAPCCSSEIPEHSSALEDAHLEASRRTQEEFSVTKSRNPIGFSYSSSLPKSAISDSHPETPVATETKKTGQEHRLFLS